MRGGGLIIAAPASGSGKTVVTLAILRALTRARVRVQSFKVGPDYIDPAFHAAATGRPCFNLDPWAMRPATVTDLLGRLNVDAALIVGEGVMGLFDGASDGTGSTADVAATDGMAGHPRRRRARSGRIGGGLATGLRQPSRRCPRCRRDLQPRRRRRACERCCAAPWRRSACRSWAACRAPSH